MSWLEHQIEALLFVADRPINLGEFAELVLAPEPQIREALTSFGARLANSSSLQLVHIAGGYQLRTKSEYSALVARYLKPAKQRMSRSLMEVLAVVAYEQPVTIAEIDSIRGVQSDYGLRQLQERRLVKEVGRKQTPGRPVLYGTTQQFLHQFSLNKLDELPKLEINLASSSDALAIAAIEPQAELFSTPALEL